MSSLIDKNIISVVAIVVFDRSSQKYLIVRRAPDQSGAGFWEFPGGKVEQGETESEALVREVEEELGFTVKPSDLHFLMRSQHAYPAKSVEIAFYLYEVNQALSFRLVDHDESTWCEARNLLNYNIAAADLSMVEYLKTRMML
jgi:mutator protein MutT